MLDKAVAAVKSDKAKALDMFNKGKGGFRDRDLYVFCVNASDDHGASDTQRRAVGGHQRQEGLPARARDDEEGHEGKVGEVTYWWPRPGSDKPLEKTSFYTKVEDQICDIGYYK